jgi:hypothetical protein
MQIISRMIVSMRNLVYITLCRWPSGMQVTLHTRLSSTQSDISQISHWYILLMMYTGLRETVVNRYKDTWKIVRKVGYLQWSYQDARSTKHKKINETSSIGLPHILLWILKRVIRLVGGVFWLCYGLRDWKVGVGLMTARRWSWRVTAPTSRTRFHVVFSVNNGQLPYRRHEKFTVTNFVTSISSVRSGSFIYFFGNFCRLQLNRVFELVFCSW